MKLRLIKKQRRHMAACSRIQIRMHARAENRERAKSKVIHHEPRFLFVDVVAPSFSLAWFAAAEFLQRDQPEFNTEPNDSRRDAPNQWRIWYKRELKPNIGLLMQCAFDKMMSSEPVSFKPEFSPEFHGNTWYIQAVRPDSIDVVNDSHDIINNVNILEIEL